MSHVFTLSQLLGLVQDTLDAQFYGQAFWVKCEVTDVKKYDAKNWCFCKLLEKKGGQVLAETPGVFWQQGYQHIRKFEKVTGRKFENGIEINALATVKFHAKFGFKIEIIEIDLSYTLGQMELARQESIQKLLANFPKQIRQIDDIFYTYNNQLALPRILQKVALITANHSDGQRDFMQELTQNAYGYPFKLTGFYTTIQGETAAAGMVKQLKLIESKSHLFDVVAIVRGGGSQTDLKPFDDYELAKTIALFPIPVFTGIGHDRNTSITDLMARQFKVPTKVAAAIVDHNFRSEQNLLELQDKMQDKIESILFEKNRQLDKWTQKIQWTIPSKISLYQQQLIRVKGQLQVFSQGKINRSALQIKQVEKELSGSLSHYLRIRQENLSGLGRLVEQLSPETILKKGFSMIEQDGKIVTHIKDLDKKRPLVTRLSSGSVESTIIKIEPKEIPMD